jgi:hypothetical protein
MAKHGRNFVLFVTAISVSAILIPAAPAGANPGFAEEQPPGLLDPGVDLVTGLLDVLGLRKGATATGSTRQAANGCAPASATASGDCPSASRVASTGGTAVTSEPIASAVPVSAATPARLAFTGSLTGQLAVLAAALIIAGFSLVRLGGRRPVRGSLPPPEFRAY